MSKTATEKTIRSLEFFAAYDQPQLAHAKLEQEGITGYNAWLAWKAAKVSVAMQQREFEAKFDREAPTMP